MSKQNELLSKFKEIFDNQGETLKVQRILIQETSCLNEMIKKVINEFSETKTNINLLELLSPSSSSRAISIPRPQNRFLLFRKNFSKGLVKANISMSVGESSKFASEYWKHFISDRERSFWHELSKIAKEIHATKYPNYKYSPVKNHEKVTKSMLFMNIDEEKIDSHLEDHNQTDHNDNDMIIDQPLNTELNELFNIDSQYNLQNFYPDSILNQNEISFNFNGYDSLIDPVLYNTYIN